MLMMQESATDRAVWFEQEVEGVVPDLLGAALRLAKNEADAQDLVADAVARAWVRLDDLRDRKAFRGWLFRILTNSFISRCRADAGGGAAEPYEEQNDEAAFSLFERLHQPFLLWWHNPEREFLNRLLRQDLERAIDALPEPFRIVVVLADLQGLSYQEMADTLGVPLGTVRSRLARARGLLQKALWTHAVDAGLRPAAPPTADPT
jgi:RNA polymerase sigma-70 factor (ECF subfamily)